MAPSTSFRNAARSPVLALLAVVAAVACTESGTDDEGLSGGDGAHGLSGSGGSGDTGGAPADPGCEGPLGAPVSADTLPTCCPEYGEAHCVQNIPDTLLDYTAPCDGGGYCVPDIFIETGGVYTPPACDSMIGGPGVCLSACIPAVAEQIALLSQDICAASERCVPCVNPLDNMPTGACDLAFSCEGQGGGGGEGGGTTMPPCDDPATCEYDLATTCAGHPAADPSAFPACPTSVCSGGGHCIPSAAVDPAQAALLADCDASNKCVPDGFIETAGAFTAPTCDSVGGFEGRCLSSCLPDVAAQIDQLPQSLCTANERCVPCFDPFTGVETGACSLSCDAGPTEPAQTFAKCCQGLGGGTCLPIDLVGQEAAAQLDPVECQDLGQAGAVCVPDAIYQAHAQGQLFQPADCTTGFLVQLIGASAEGACLPRCIPEVENQFGLSQSDCQDGYDCVPCTDQNGEDTGACHPQ